MYACWTRAREEKWGKTRLIRTAEVGLTEAAGEIFEDALIVDVIIAINCKVVT